MNVTLYFNDGLVKSHESVDQIKDNYTDYELYKYDWKDELFMCCKYKKRDIARLSVR